MTSALTITIGLGVSNGAAAHPCKDIDHPTTIDHDKKCVRVTETVAGDVVNNATVGEDDNDRPGFLIGGDGRITGALVNNGTIRGGGDDRGALTLGRDADVEGGIFNSGTIASAQGNAIQLGYLAHGYWPWPRAAALTGDIVNEGAIDGHRHGIAALYGTMSGALINEADGTILGGDAAVFIADTFASWSGGILNRGVIEGGANGIVVESDIFGGGLFNDATGVIAGLDGDGISAHTTWSGDLENRGSVSGTRHGFAFWGPAFDGDVVNEGAIAGGDTAVRIVADILDGAFANSGEIEGGTTGVSLALGAATGGFTNAGSIEGQSAAGVRIEADAWGTHASPADIDNAAAATIEGGETGFWLSALSVFGDFVNDGHISGAADTGLHIDVVSFFGDILNAGDIAGGDTAVAVVADIFDGAFANSGEIEGGTTGVSLALGAAAGGFTNAGSIDGLTGTGVSIDAETWGTADDPADIVNAAGGTIEGGETGLWLSALSVVGDFVNDGEILGGSASTGLHIDVAQFFGDILNNGAIEAPSNAVLLEIGALDGEIRNSGTITASDADGVAVALDIATGATFVNEGGGSIFGDVILGGSAAYSFVGREGGVEGDIVGNGGSLLVLAASDDVLTVESGTHYFVDGALESLLGFDVDDGGTAVMGARFVGDPDGPGYGASNVDALNVNLGGRLYLDDDTILNVGTFTQEAGGELTYFLVAPSGEPVAGADYGRIAAAGAVTLGGTLSVILDPASFGGTTEHEFTYTDIIQGASFAGEFDHTAIVGSSYFFELALTYGATSLDLSVTRTPFDVVFCAEHLSANSEDLGAALEAAFQAGGFTPEQTALFNFLGQLEEVCAAYFDLGGAVLGDLNAITSETAGPWKSAVNDRLNSTGATSCVVAGAGGCLTRYAQNDVGGSAVMSDASDPFAWLRTGARPEGIMSVWGRILGVQGDNEGRGGATGSDFTVTGVIGGADYVFSPTFIAGLAAQWTTTDVDFKKRRDTADVQSFEIGGYFSYGDVDFCLTGNASVIFHDFDTYRFPFGDFAQGVYNGMTISAYAEAGRVFEFDLLRVEPVLALSFAALETDAYSEFGTAATLLIVDGAAHTSLRSFLGARVAYPLALLESGRKIVPELRAMWGHEFLDDQSLFHAALSTLPNHKFTVRGQEFARDSLVVGAGLNVPVSSQAVIYADYDLFLTRDQAIQSVSLGARVSW